MSRFIQRELFTLRGCKMASISDEVVETWYLNMLKSLGCTDPGWQKRIKKSAKEFMVREINNQKEKIKQRYRNNLKASA